MKGETSDGAFTSPRTAVLIPHTPAAPGGGEPVFSFSRYMRPVTGRSLGTGCWEKRQVCLQHVTSTSAIPGHPFVTARPIQEGLSLLSSMLVLRHPAIPTFISFTYTATDLGQDAEATRTGAYLINLIS